MIESLETRRLFSISVVNGILTVNGSSSADGIYLHWKVTGTTFGVKIYVNGTSQIFTTVGTSSWSAVSVYGGNGDDTLVAAASPEDSSYANTNVPPVSVTLNGGAANDLLGGSYGGDYLLGGSGNDFIDAHDGSDQLIGQDGNDTMYGGPGPDIYDARDASTPSSYVDQIADNGSDGWADILYVDRSFATLINYDLYQDYDPMDSIRFRDV